MCSRSLFFFTAAYFRLALVAASISHLFFISRSRPLRSVALFLVELRWHAAYFLFFSVFLRSIFQICGRDN